MLLLYRHLYLTSLHPLVLTLISSMLLLLFLLLLLLLLYIYIFMGGIIIETDNSKNVYQKIGLGIDQLYVH